MKNLQLYIGGVNDITYRYDIKKVGDIFNVRIFSVSDQKHTEAGTKSMRDITAHDVIDECRSHYRRNTNTVRSFFRWLGF